MANSMKYGRIVDATTGKGIPDVSVIAAANFFAGPGLGGDNTYRVISHTDENGNYWIPSTWLQMNIMPPVGSPHTRWLISAYKLGYVFVGDEQAWSAQSGRISSICAADLRA